MAQKKTSYKWGDLADEPEIPKKLKKSKDDTPVIVYENPDIIKKLKKVVDEELKRLEEISNDTYCEFNEGEKDALLLVKKVLDGGK